MRAAFLVSFTLVAALAWTLALMVRSEPFDPPAALLIGVGLVAMASVATIGMIVVGGRWAHRLGLSALAVTVIVALVRPVDVFWVIGVATTTLALVALFSPRVGSSIRRLASATGPPPRAVVPPLLLLSAPAILGLAGNGARTWALVVVALTAPNVALLYSRVFPGGLIGIRLVWPALAIGLAPVMGWPTAFVSAALGLIVGILAWDRSVKTSYHPPREVGTTFPIPPELAPEEVLDAAEIDDKGRRR
jgi:MFS family permease